MKTKDLTKTSEPENTGGHYLRSAQTHSYAPFQLQQDELSAVSSISIDIITWLMT
jgi:hypothetical protein